MKLIIFDLDQTLVDSLEIHNASVHRLFKDVFGVEARMDEIDYAGRTLSDNIRELALFKGIAKPLIEAEMPRIIRTYERIFISTLPSHPYKYILPGVEELLKILSKSGHVIALYTGSSPGVMLALLSWTKLKKYFIFAASGTMFVSRLAMAIEVVKQAEKKSGYKFEGKEIIIIGDSIRDIECGRQLNALTIAVATGSFTMHDLTARQPDYTFRDLSQTDAVLNAITSAPVLN